MSTWTPEELDAVGNADELQITSVRDDGTLRPYVIIWTVRSGDELYVRTAYGPDAGWYRRAKASGIGRIRAGGVERDVTFAAADAAAQAGIDVAYHAKYDRYGARIVGTVVGEQVHPLTIRLEARDAQRVSVRTGARHTSAMSIEQWWPKLTPTTREWLVENNGDRLPADVAEEVAAAGGPQSLSDEDTDWIEATANGEQPD